MLEETRSCEWVWLRGTLDAEMLSAAVSDVAAAHPMLTARWSDGAWRTPADALKLQVEHLPDALTRDTMLARSWEGGDAHLADVTLLRTPSRDLLRVRVPHARTDARAGAQVIADLAEAYDRRRRGDTPLGSVDCAPWPTERLFRTTWRHRLLAVGRLLGDALRRPGWSTSGSAPSRGAGVHVAELVPGALEHLRAKARDEGTSVHVLLTLAVARVTGARRLMDLATVHTMASEDLARRADLLVVPWVLHIPDDDAAAALAIRAQVDAVKQGGALAELARLAIYDALARWLPVERAAALTFRHVVKADVASTNPGPVRVALDMFGDVPIDDFLNFPHAVPPARRIFAWTTFRGRLRLVVQWRDGDPVTARAQTEAICARLGLRVDPTGPPDEHDRAQGPTP